MKFITLLFFNIISFYILVVFVIGNGGIIDNLKKVALIYQMENKKLTGELELENLKTKLYRLQSLAVPDYSILAEQGKKADKMIIFKYINQKENNIAKTEINIDIYKYRIFFTGFLAVILIITGNILIYIIMGKKGIEK